MATQISAAEHTDSSAAGKPDRKVLEQVTVSASSARMTEHVETAAMGKTNIPVSMLAKTVSIGGEPDVIKALQLTPGIKRGTEGNINMYVRGGGSDENLVLLDGAPLYNVGHMLGFFSLFNTASVRDVQMYKSAFPSSYGGRLSSVMDVSTKNGSLTDYKASASISTIASSATVQGPVIKDRLSLIASYRRTYIDKVMKDIPYYFYDVNAKAMLVINSSNRLYAGVFAGDDILLVRQQKNPEFDTTLKTNTHLGNKLFTLRWNNIARDNKYATDVLLYHTAFRYNISGSMGGNSLAMHSAIGDLGIKADTRVYHIPGHKIGMGAALIHHTFNPNIINTSGAELERFGNNKGILVRNVEAAVYINDEYNINKRWLLQSGLRISGLSTGSKLYLHPEPRIAARYLVNERNSVKLSYARMVQYMHQVTGSSVTLPTDLWYPATGKIKPGISDQWSVGYYHSIPSTEIALSAEVYYKTLSNVMEYKEGAQLMLNSNFEQDIVSGKGKTYGIELLATKTAGKFTGWVGYTLSYARRYFDSLNNGQPFYARHDRRHDISFVGLMDISKHWSAGTTVVYSTGSPFTGQTGQYVIPAPGFSGFDAMPVYTSRNAMRLSASFRIDASLQYKFTIGNKLKGDVQLSVYNMLNRTQPSNVERVWDANKKEYKYRQTGLFGTITAGAISINI